MPPLRKAIVLVVLIVAWMAAPASNSKSAESNSVPTEDDAKAFVADAERELATLSEWANRAEWVARTFITFDTNWLEAKTDAELSTFVAVKAKEAAKFDDVDVDLVTRRKLDLLKRSLVLPPPAQPGASEVLSELSVKLRTLYSTGKVEYDGQELTLDDIAGRMRSSRDPVELKTLWEGWHGITPPMREPYARLVNIVRMPSTTASGAAGSR